MKPISVIIVANGNRSDLEATERSITHIAAEVIIVNLYNVLSCSSHQVINCNNNITEALIKAERACANKWIFYLYAGELVPVSIATQLQYLYNNHCDKKYQAFSLSVISLPSSPLTTISPLLYPKTRSVRLYNKECNSFTALNAPVNLYDSSLLNKVVKEQDVFLLEGSIDQYCLTDLAVMLDHLEPYTSLYAQELQLYGYEQTAFGVIKSILNIPYMLLYKGFFSWGIKGLVYSILTTVQKLVAYYKLSTLASEAESLYSKNS